MKIQFASDLHLEVDSNFKSVMGGSIKPVGDILLLAGDVFVMERESLDFQDFFDWCSSNFKHTFIVPGNHEFYGGADVASTLQGREIALRDNVRCLNNKSVVIGDVEFFFTTLWATVEQENEAIVTKYMPECGLASFDGRPFAASDYTPGHITCLNWLTAALESSRAVKKVVVTHHCPVQVEDPRYESNGLSSAFVNPMEDYVAACGASVWAFGHTHYNGARGMKLGDTILVTNQLGYVDKGVCDGFDETIILEM